MSAFRRVDDCRAGPSALGILVPPGAQTLVVLRPRALTWDLLAIRSERNGGARFCHFGREAAATLARRVQQELEKAACDGVRLVETVVSPSGTGFEVQVRAGDYTWLVCPREPGKAYRPLRFAARAEAEAAARSLARVLCPPTGTNQEFYFNTQNFSR